MCTHLVKMTDVGPEPLFAPAADPQSPYRIDVVGRDVTIVREEGGLGMVILPSPQQRGIRV